MPVRLSRGTPIPAGWDPVDVPRDIQALAEWVDQMPGVSPISEPERNELSGNDRWVGRTIFNMTRLRTETWNGQGWVVPGGGGHGDLNGRDAIDAHQQYVRHEQFNSHNHTGQNLSDFLTQELAEAKGDMLVASGPNAFARMAVGAPGTALVADSNSPTGMKWAGATKSVSIDVWKGNDQILPNAMDLGTHGRVTFNAQLDDPLNMWDELYNVVVVPPGYAGRWFLSNRTTAPTPAASTVPGAGRPLVRREHSSPSARPPSAECPVIASASAVSRTQASISTCSAATGTRPSPSASWAPETWRS